MDPNSAIGHALQCAGKTELLSFYPPPNYPKGWRGTYLDGDPAEFAAEYGGKWDQPRSEWALAHAAPDGRRAQGLRARAVDAYDLELAAYIDSDADATWERLGPGALWRRLTTAADRRDSGTVIAQD